MDTNVSYGDKVRVQQWKLDSMANLEIMHQFSGVGTVVKNHHDGLFTVRMPNRLDHLFYANELEVVKKHECQCLACEEKRAKEIEMAQDILREQTRFSDDYVAPDGSC